MLPLTSYSTSFIGVEASTELNNSSSITQINEDDERRYIRKVFHKIRNARKEKRQIDILMNSWVYNVVNFNLNGIVFKRVILQIKNYNFTNIDVSRYEEVFAYNQLSGLSSTGLEFDNKLTLYFENEYDKKIAIDYINAKDKDDFIPAFSHFNLAKVDSEIIQRQNNPELISQDPSLLCGIACIANIIAKNLKLDFKYLIKDLFFYAEAFFGRNKYLIKPRNSLFGQIYHVSPNDEKNYPQYMPQADFISLCSIKCSENKLFSYDGKDDGQFIDGLGSLSTPSELVHLLEKMLSATDIQNHTNITGAFFDELDYLQKMDDAKNQGYECLMLIDSAMIEAPPANLFKKIKTKLKTELPWPNHWVMYAGELTQTIDKVSFKVFSWGGYKVADNSKDFFKDTFYGFIQCKFK